jgi:V/A-type H+-transporting ATPase subunit I
MIFPERMRQLVAVVLDRDSDAVTRELLAQGVLHFLRVTEVDKAVAAKVEEVTPRVTEAMIAEIRKRIESFFAMAGENRAPAVQLRIEDLQPVDLEETNRRLDQFAASIQEVRDQQLTLQQEILKLEDIRRQLEMFSALPVGSGIRGGSQYSFLNVQTGTLRSSLLEGFTQALKGVPSVQMTIGETTEGPTDHRVTLLLITMRRDDGAVRRTLEQFGWEEARLPREAATGTREEALKELEPRLVRLRSEQATLGGRVTELVREKRGMLEEVWENLRLNELYVRVQTYFSRTSRTVLFTGWLPANRQKGLEEGVRRAAGGRCYLEWHGPKDSAGGQEAAVPVRFSNPRFLSPFQMLVQNYAVPEYGTVEPTPFVAVAYLIMFGLMFGDVGHGLVLAILAVLGLVAYKGQSDNIRNLFRLGIWCGGAAVLAGALFGSYFGMQWLRPLWFDFHGLVSGHSEGEYRVKDIYGVLLITIYFGITVIGFGLVLNWVNLVAKGRWLRLAFDKGGLLGGWIYAGGVYIAFYYVRHDYHQLPPGLELLLGAGLPALLLFLKGPVELLLHKDKPFTLMSPLDFLMEWILEMLEIFSGYLANTLSFMRVAGLGIAHVSLLIAFFSIAGMLRAPGGAYTVGSYLVLLFGNVLVIALEGLSAGIQSLRLNYYEFFSKYFSGTGKIYEPVSLRSRK